MYTHIYIYIYMHLFQTQEQVQKGERQIAMIFNADHPYDLLFLFLCIHDSASGLCFSSGFFASFGPSWLCFGSWCLTPISPSNRLALAPLPPLATEASRWWWMYRSMMTLYHPC